MERKKIKKNYEGMTSDALISLQKENEKLLADDNVQGEHRGLILRSWELVNEVLAERANKEGK